MLRVLSFLCWKSFSGLSELLIYVNANISESVFFLTQIQS